MKTLKNYSDLSRLSDFTDRFRYLQLRGSVGSMTFGFDRYINQRFYTSQEWKQIRDFVITRDQGYDLGVEDHEIAGRILVHHMNPMTVEAIQHSHEEILNPEYLISVSHQTHNAIHYGDEGLLAKPLIDRRPGDTKLW